MRGINMSYTVVLLPILSVLSIAHNNYLQPDKMWQNVNTEQQFFTDTYWPLNNQLKLLNEQELTSIISADIGEVNRFLKSKGFDIQLSPYSTPHPKNRAIASVLDILLKWKVKGTESQIEVNTREYPAIFMPTNKSCRVRMYHSQEVAIIKAENNDTVYLMMASENQALPKDFALVEYLKNIDEKNLTWGGDYQDVLFPMVDINDKPDISWLIGLQFPMANLLFQSNVDFEITQALQQTKFQMNEEGAAAQSAVAIAIEVRSVSINPPQRKHLVIDKPFYVWIKRDGIDIPVFAAYVDQENWKKPAKLGNK